MVPFKKIQDSVSGDLERLNRIISDTLKSRSPLMQQVVDNFLASKGKQLRPILVILSGRMFNGGDAAAARRLTAFGTTTLPCLWATSL